MHQFINNVYEIIESKIEKNLNSLSKRVLVDLPETSITPDEFMARQIACIKKKSGFVQTKNIEVEEAVKELIHTIVEYSRDPEVKPVSEEVVSNLSKYYNW